MNRRHFLRNSAALGATAALWQLAPPVAFSQVRWEEEKEPLPLEDDPDAGLGPMRQFEEGAVPQARTDWPVIATDAGGTPWVAFVREQLGAGEEIYLRRVAEEGFADAEEVQLSSADGFASWPVLVAAGDGLAAAWVEKHGDDWRLKGCRIGADGTPAEVVDLAPSDGMNWRPALAADPDDGRVLVAWERQAPGDARFAIMAREWAADGAMSPVRGISNSHDRDCHRAAAAITDGGGWVAWDQLDAPGAPNVYLSRVTDSGPQPPRQITHHPAANLCPALAAGTNGRLWIAFTSNRRGADQWDIPRWIHLLCLENGRLMEPAAPMRDKNLDKEGTDQSYEFPQLMALADGRVVVLGRVSHNFNLQVFGGDECSPLYRLPVESWGGRGQFLQASAAPEGGLWMVRREYGGNVLQRLEDLPTARSPVTLRPSEEERLGGVPLVNIQTKPGRWPALEASEGNEEELNIYFGDLHGHTRMSDGLGDVDEYFYTRRDYYTDDFAALTDHDNFVRLPIFPSGWAYQKAMMKKFSEDGRFPVFYSQEYTSARYPGAIGHKCVYSLREDLQLFDHTQADYNSSEELNAAVRAAEGLLIPHHTGWIGTDWEGADPEIQMLVEMCSNHGVFEYPGNEPIPHRGNNQGCFVQDALARGLRVGFIGGSDSHGLLWHHHAGWKRDCNRTGLAAVLAPDLTRESLFDALRRRRCYATTGNKPRLDFRVNDHLMGEEITAGEGPVRISANISSREDIRWVTVVKNNQDFYRYGGDGFTTRFSITDDDQTPGTHWYYLRVEFEGPDMAWSSPVWVTRGG